MKWSFNDKLRKQAPDAPGGAPADPVAPAAAPVQPDAGPDLSFIPADYHVDGKPDLGKFATSYQELVARDAQRAEAEAARAATIPEGDYEFALDPDLKFDGLELPEGFTQQLQLEDEAFKPIFADLSGALKEMGAPADAGKKIVGLLAKYEAVQYDRAARAMTADLAKLGTPAQVDARIATVSRALETRLPAEQAAALKAMARSSSALQALEKLVMSNTPMTTPTPAPAGAATEGLSAYERLKLANAGGR